MRSLSEISKESLETAEYAMEVLKKGRYLDMDRFSRAYNEIMEGVPNTRKLTRNTCACVAARYVRELAGHVAKLKEKEDGNIGNEKAVDPPKKNAKGRRNRASLR